MYNNRQQKVYSQRQHSLPNKHKFENRKDSIELLLAGRDSRGKILLKSSTNSRQISVKVLRYTTLVTSDKLATGYRQKGVIKCIKDKDMPQGVDKRRNLVKFNIIVALLSILNRLTTGQYYKIVAGAKAAREGKRVVIQPRRYTDKHIETVLYNSKTGEIIDRLENNKDIPVLTLQGIYRVQQITQLSQDKQHYTYSTARKYSISTRLGRTAGSRLRFREIEAHATDRLGFTAATSELKSRIDLIDTSFCTKHNTFP